MIGGITVGCMFGMEVLSDVITPIRRYIAQRL